jgi:hypothetical protein
VSLNSQEGKVSKMRVYKVLFVLVCLLAFALAFSMPIPVQAGKPASVFLQNSAAVTDALPFKALVERACPLFVDRQMTLKIADVPAGQQVTVLEKTDMNRGDGLVVLLVSYAGRNGKEMNGWLYGTLHVHLPR